VALAMDIEMVPMTTPDKDQMEEFVQELAAWNLTRIRLGIPVSFNDDIGLVIPDW